MAKTRVSQGQINPAIKFDGSAGIVLPVGTTAQRAGVPRTGEVRYNSDLGVFEGYTGGAWGTIGPFPGTFVEYFTGDGTTYEFTTSQAIGNVDYLVVTVNGIQLTYNVDYRVEGTNVISFTETDSTQNPPLLDAEITVRGFVAVTSASVTANSIGITELALSDGTSGQVLTTNGAGTISFQTIPTQDPTMGGDIEGTASNAQIKENVVGVRELDVSDGLQGQVLATDGAGNLVFINPPSGGSGGGASSFFDLSGVIQLNQIGDETITNEKIGTYQLTPDRIATADSSVGSAGQILSIDGNGDFTWISVVGSGEANTASNVGAGSGIFLQKSGVDLQFKTLVAGTGIGLNPTANTIEIQNTRSAFTSVAVAGQSPVVADSAFDTLTLVAGAGITITTNALNDEVSITSSATAPNQWLTFLGDSGATTANTTTDQFTIAGGAGISTSITGDALTIVNNSPNVDQNLWATVTADSGSTTANSTTDSLAIVGGTGISTAIVGDTLTITNTGGVIPNNFGTIAVAGQSNVVADSSSDTLTIVAGSNITITTDAGTDTITINSSAGSGGSGTVTSGTADRLAYYATTGTTIVETSSDLTWDNGTATLTVANLDVTGTVGNLTTGTINSGAITSSGAITATTINADLLRSTSAGTPTFESGNDIIFRAAGEINFSSDIVTGIRVPTQGLHAANKQYVDEQIDTTFKHFNIAADDSTLRQINSGETIKIIGSGGATTSSDAEGNITITATGEANQNAFETISVTGTGGQPNIVAGSATSTVTFDAGTNMIINTNAGTGVIQFTSTASGGATNLNGLSDVNTVGVSDGDTLVNISGTWVPVAGPVIQWTVGNNGSSDYTFTGPGFPTTQNDPTLYLYRGHTYRFNTSNMAGAHPFYIKTAPGTGTGNQYTDGVTNNGSATLVVFEVPMNAPATLYYQCSLHAGMVGTINIV